MRLAPGPVRAVVAEVHLAAQDGLYARLLALLEEAHGPEHVVVVGESHRRHGETFGALDQVRDAQRAIQHGEMRVDVQVNERGVAHGQPIQVAEPGARRQTSRAVGRAFFCLAFCACRSLF